MYNRKYDHLHFRICMSINAVQDHSGVCGCHVAFVADHLAVDWWSSDWGVLLNYL